MAIKKNKSYLKCSCGRKSKSAQNIESAFIFASKEGWSRYTNTMKQDKFNCPSCTNKIKKLVKTSKV